MSKPLGQTPIPNVFLGDTVLWKHSASDPDSDGAVAYVTKVGDGGSLGLLVMPPESRAGVLKDGVLHATDARNLTRMDQSSGIWVHTRRTNQIADLAARIAALEIETLVADTNPE